MITTDQGIDPRTGVAVGAPVPHTPPAEVHKLARRAAAAAPALAALPPPERAARLRAVAAALAGARDELVALADAETGLGEARLGGELTRTRLQLELFADAVEEGSFLDVIIDHADPDALPAPRPDVRRLLVPLGPVAVFAASNFPFAFSVAGTDTASAWAAGCPVVVKAHPGHPGLSARCAEIIAGALAAAGAPEGAFGIVYGVEAGLDLVRHPDIAAVAFTGSLAGGRALFDLAAGRPDPIPFFGELGSLNPTVVTPGAVAERGPEIVRGFVASYTLGSGQFCTKPGLLFLPVGHGLDEALVAETAGAALGPLLGARIRDGFREVAARLAGVPGVRRLTPEPAGADAAGAAATTPGAGDPGGSTVEATLLATTAPALVARAEDLLHECFGPAALVVEYASPAELAAALDALPGSLTGTVHAAQPAESELLGQLLERLQRKAGRVIVDGWPTGVAVTWAQHHGGPWPTTTAAAHTSVGVTAMRRFLRPVAYQGVPDTALPPPLREANPWGLPRRVDGRMLLAATTIHSGRAQP